MGRDFPISDSTKQKLNTPISNEPEIVGVDDFLPGILWTGLFGRLRTTLSLRKSFSKTT